jgi:hypothetical protein
MRMVQVPFGRTMVSRLAPDLGPEHFKTFTMSAPFKTHWRLATCEEYECDGVVNGFVTTVDMSTDLGQRQYHYLTHDEDRSPVIQRVGPKTFKFMYRPGTPCFQRGDHRVPIGRPPFYLVSDGDWRGNPRRTQALRHRRAEDWIDQFANHQDEIATTVKRG